ncbi:MAG: adenylosuccinate synthase [Candidatus Marinimicrobia bacterium]|nr:adenylosuccinate synthase [Candidatus Neomarinimicrobiota bacterium]|tara:strand:- start:2455 stop:3756 length:1302 start_codon:yes stop_codon:yes gene_type:complete
MTDKSNVTAIVGTQWGDEGKGKITDYFAGKSDYVIRFQGGNNAGHTVIVNDNVYKLHHIPSGVLYSKPISVIGNGVLINPKDLIQEINSLEEKEIKPNLKISDRAHVIMPYHIVMDECLTSHQGDLAAGSTKRGIAPAYADKAYRHGIRIGDLVEPAIFEEKLQRAYEFNEKVVTQAFGRQFDLAFEDIYTDYLSYGDALKKYLSDTQVELFEAYSQGKSFLFEGAQGLSLDLDHGLYPHTTSSNTVAGQMSVGSGIGINGTQRVIGVAKAYVSRVGISPFPTELKGEDAEYLRERGSEYGTTTGRPRRVGWLDLVQLRQAVRVNGLTEISLTKMDILCGMDTLKICTQYEINDEKLSEMPGSLGKMRQVKPVYTSVLGWPEKNGEEIEEICSQGYNMLPDNMKVFIDFIEQEINCPITIVSLGPQRHQTILR